MSYKLSVIRDNPIGYYPLDDFSVTNAVAYDYSGCENDSAYQGTALENELIPLVVGNDKAAKIGNTNSIVYSLINDYTGVP